MTPDTPASTAVNDRRDGKPIVVVVGVEELADLRAKVDAAVNHAKKGLNL